jgi:hypothetical protein
MSRYLVPSASEIRHLTKDLHTDPHLLPRYIYPTPSKVRITIHLLPNLTSRQTIVLMAASANNTRFDAEAAEWDNNKKHVESCEKAYEAIKHYVPAFFNGTSKSI